MPLKKTIERAKKDKREGKSASTQAGEFVREEIENIRKGKHGVRNVRQAIAIGLSIARRAGVKLSPPAKGTAPEKTRRKAKRELERAKSGPIKPSPKRSRAALKALKRESTRAASRQSLSRHATTAARRRAASDRSASARKAARTKGPAERSAAARKAARTRAKG